MRNLEPGGETLTILMLEDDPLDRELVQERLRQAGYNFHAYETSTRAEFEQAVGARQYDLVLADYSLPDFDGLTALEIIRSRDPDLPFIFVSGVLGEHVAVETLHRGATDYVLKQRMERLTPAVSRALKEYSERLSRIEAENLLRKSEQLLNQMTNALPAMVWTTDHAGVFTYCNDAWKQYVGSDQLTSWCDSSVLHLDDVSHGSRQWQEALSSGAPLELECRFRRSSDSSYRWHLVRVVPLKPGDSQSSWVGTCTDMHGQKQREESLRTSEKLVVIGRMAGAIAHEINNPLESLVNLLYLLRDSDTSVEPAKSLLEEADQQLFRVSSITRQTLTFYRDKAALGDIDCRSLIEDTLALFRAKLRERKINVVMDTESQVNLQARAGEIRQVIINLVSNAIDAMRDGGTLTLRARRVPSPERDTILLQVEDTGHGIAPEVRNQLFQPFFSTKGTLGTGLGLWVTRNIIDRHRGTIDIDSIPGRTSISVRLPAEYCGDDEEASSADSQSNARRIAS